MCDIFFKKLEEIPNERDFSINDMTMILIEKIFVYATIWTIGGNLR